MRSSGPTGNAPMQREWVGLPPRPFMYTLDQIATLLSVPESRVRRDYCWYENREVGTMSPLKLKTVNVSPSVEAPDWRVSEQELIRWMKKRRLKYYERAWLA